MSITHENFIYQNPDTAPPQRKAASGYCRHRPEHLLRIGSDFCSSRASAERGRGINLMIVRTLRGPTREKTSPRVGPCRTCAASSKSNLASSCACNPFPGWWPPPPYAPIPKPIKSLHRRGGTRSELAEPSLQLRSLFRGSCSGTL